MLKKFIASCMVMYSLCATAQCISEFRYDESTEKVTIGYRPKTQSQPKLAISINGGDWIYANSILTIPTDYNTGYLVWDVFNDFPNGVRNASIRVFGFSEKDLESIDKSCLPYNASKGIVFGNQAYFLVTHESSQYAGDLRQGTAATATDKVTKSADVYIYDFFTREWDKRYNVVSWEGRVPRKTHGGLFPAPKIPSYSIEITPSGKVYVNNTLITDATDAAASTNGTFTLLPHFSYYAKKYVEGRINQWQAIGEFEKRRTTKNES